MRGMRLIALATALGGVASFIAAGLIGEPAVATRAERPVVVAASPIAVGETVRPELLTRSQWANEHELPPADAVASVDAIAGRIAKIPLQAGRVLRDSDFYPRPDAIAMSLGIGMRAYVARISDLSQVVGFGGPGSTVDVMLSATRNVPQPFSRMILTGVRVLAVRAEIKPGDQNAQAAPTASLVTFELTTEQAETLDLARLLGELTLVMRNPGDPDNSVSGGVRVADLMGAMQPKQPEAAPVVVPEPETKVIYVTKPAPAPAAPPPPVVVQEIRGGIVMMRKEPG